MFFGSSKLVGLDIGTSTIKLVEVEGSGKKISLSAFGYVPTPTGAIVAGEIADADALTGAIIELLKQTKTKRNKAAVGICGTSVITKKISIPRIEEKLLAEQLKWEAEQYIPFDINEINLGYHILKNSPAPAEQMNILLVAAKRDHVMKYAEVVEGAGLNCAVVDVAGFALANCYEANYGLSKQGTVGIVCMGTNIAHFVILENGEVTFCRDLVIGGNTYTTDIVKQMGITLAEAESMKVSASTGQAVPTELTEIISQTNETVADEIRRSFDFYLATASDANVQKFYLSGGGFKLKGLGEKIGSSLGIPVEALNPFAGIQYDARTFSYDYLSQISPYIGVGLGLALRRP